MEIEGAGASGGATIRTAARSALAGIVAILLLLGALGAYQTGAAATLEARWSLYGRADATSFVAGNTGVPAPGAGGGYEIVTLHSVPVSSGLATYMYAGADLPAIHGGPMDPIISCTATYSATQMNLLVSGGYPYAGCVFFLGVTNTGDGPFHVSLGSLDERAEVTCNAPGCQRTDLDILGGGATPAEVAELCAATGGTVEALGEGVYSVPPGVTFVCPLFVTVLQPAKEGATYVVSLIPPPPETVIEVPLVPEQRPPGLTNRPPNTFEEPTATPTSPTPTPTPTPVTETEGERTAGPAVTPLPPETGGSIVVRRSHAEGYNLLAALLLVASAAAGIAALHARGNSP